MTIQNHFRLGQYPTGPNNSLQWYAVVTFDGEEYPLNFDTTKPYIWQYFALVNTGNKFKFSYTLREAAHGVESGHVFLGYTDHPLFVEAFKAYADHIKRR